MEAFTGKSLRPLTIVPQEWPKAEPVADGDARTLMQVLESIRRYWLLILAIAVAGATLAAIAGMVMSRSYMAAAQLNTRVAGAMDGAGGALGAVTAGSEESTIDTHVTVLSSDGYLRRLLPALRTLDGARETTIEPRVASAVRDAWSNIKRLFPVGQNRPSEGAELNALKSRLKVSQERRSRIISVIFTDADPKRAADVANLVARSYVDELIRQKQAFETQALDANTAQSAAVQRDLASAKAELDANRLGLKSPSLSAAQDWKLTTLAQQFETLLRRRQELTTKGMVSDPEVTLIAEATPPETPSSLNPLLLIPPVTVVAGLLACLLAIVLHRIDRTLHTEVEATEALCTPCLGLIPSLPLEMSTPPRRISASPSIAPTGAIRSAVVTLLAAGPPDLGTQQAVLVTSSGRREGKTAISWSFAFCAAQLGRRVLLLDLNHTSGQSDCDAENLIQVLANDYPLLRAIRPVQELGIDYLLASTSDRNVLSLLAHPRMPAMFEQIRDAYDLVVIDAPALQDAPEVRLLARWADHVLLVVRAGSTRRDIVKAMLHQFSRIVDVDNTKFWSVLTHKYPAPAPSGVRRPIGSVGMMRYQRMRATQKQAK